MTTTPPKPPATIWLLAAIAAAGLIAQLIAAEAAFELLGRGPTYAWAAAALIEAAAVAEALELMRTGDDLTALLLAGTLAVSAIYNYTTAHTANPSLAAHIKVALALGPLLALVSLGLLIGRTLRQHQARLDQWHADQLTQAEAEAAYQRRIQEDQRQRQHTLQQQQLQHQLKEQALATRRAERWARQQQTTERPLSAHPTNGRSPIAQPAQWANKWATKTQFLSELSANPDLQTEIAALTGADLARLTGKPPSTARRWMSDARQLITTDNHKEQTR